MKHSSDVIKNNKIRNTITFIIFSHVSRYICKFRMIIKLTYLCSSFKGKSPVKPNQKNTTTPTSDVKTKVPCGDVATGVDFARQNKNVTPTFVLWKY